MSGRDDLEELIAKAVYCVPMEGHSYLYEIEIDSPGAAADAVLAAGWRPTASLPERVSEGRLRKCPAHPGHAPFLAVHACPWCEISKLQAARSTVTPEQVERALRKLDTVSGILNSLATDAANGLRELDNIRAGLSVAEDGEQ